MINKKFGLCEIQLPGWSGSGGTCPDCKSERTAQAGGLFYGQDGKVYMHNKKCCFDCKYSIHENTEKGIKHETHGKR